MSDIVLVLGGARSGKSAFAEGLAAAGPMPVWYVATAEVHDDEMQARVAEHQARRPAGWHTVEAPRDVGAALRGLAAVSGARPGTVLLDDLGLLASNLLLAICGDAEPDREAARQLEVALAAEVAALVAAQRDGGWRLIVVSQEVGLGIVPATPLGRVFRDALGRANQLLAAESDEAYLLAAGLPLRLKPR